DPGGARRRRRTGRGAGRLLRHRRGTGELRDPPRHDRGVRTDLRPRRRGGGPDLVSAGAGRGGLGLRRSAPHQHGGGAVPVGRRRAAVHLRRRLHGDRPAGRARHRERLRGHPGPGVRDQRGTAPGRGPGRAPGALPGRGRRQRPGRRDDRPGPALEPARRPAGRPAAPPVQLRRTRLAAGGRRTGEDPRLAAGAGGVSRAPLLEAQGLCHAFDAHTVLDGVDLHVAEGEVLGLVGPNGSGKTTALRILHRALVPDAGRVHLEGRDLASLSGRERAQRIAVMAQELSGEVPLTAADVVLLGRVPHAGAFGATTGEDQQIAADALETTGALHLARREFGLLSGGEKQRVLIARALAQQPRLLLMDEPTNHLDIGSQHHVLEIVRSRGLATVVVLHDLNLAARYCDPWWCSTTAACGPTARPPRRSRPTWWAPPTTSTPSAPRPTTAWCSSCSAAATAQPRRPRPRLSIRCRGDSPRRPGAGSPGPSC